MISVITYIATAISSKNKKAPEINPGLTYFSRKTFPTLNINAIITSYPGHVGRKVEVEMTPYETLSIVFLVLTFCVSFAMLVLKIDRK